MSFRFIYSAPRQSESVGVRIGWSIPPSLARMLRLLLLPVVVVLAMQLLPICFWLVNLGVNANFHEVIPQTLYRSAQMSPETIERTLERYHIASVLDLRISGRQKEGTAERLAVEAFGATYVHLPLHTTRVPSKEELLHLLAVLPELKTPVLIHCSGGALRTGVVVAMWLLEVGDRSLAEAGKSLALWYGYTPLEYYLSRWWNGHPPLPQVWYDYRRYVQQVSARVGEEPLRFGAWVSAGRTVKDEKGKETFRPAEQGSGRAGATPIS